MKPHLRDSRSVSIARASAPETLRRARTVTQPVAHPVVRRMPIPAEFDRPPISIPRSVPHSRVGDVRQVLRIGYVMDRFPRGSHGFVLQEILELEARGVEVHIFSLDMPDGRIDDTACALARLRGPVRYFPEAGLYGTDTSSLDSLSMADSAAIVAFATSDPIGSSSAAQWIANQVKARRIDHLHAHGASEPTDVAREASRLTGIGFSFTAHAEGLCEGVNEALLCEKVLDARFVVALSEFDHQHLLRICGPWATAKLHRIPMGVNTDEYRFSEAECHDSDSVLAVGPLVETSGFTDLIEAIGILRDRGRVARLTILGEGEFEETLRAQIDRCRLAARVQILGGLSRSELAMVMRTHTAMVLPWVADGRDRDVLSNVVLEAMAVGLVVLSTDVSGIRELIDDGLSGRVISPRDPLWLAGALETLFDSPELRARMAGRARSKVMRLFSAPRNVSQLARLFGRTVSRQKIAT